MCRSTVSENEKIIVFSTIFCCKFAIELYCFVGMIAVLVDRQSVCKSKCLPNKKKDRNWPSSLTCTMAGDTRVRRLPGIVVHHDQSTRTRCKLLFAGVTDVSLILSCAGVLVGTREHHRINQHDWPRLPGGRTAWRNRITKEWKVTVLCSISLDNVSTSHTLFSSSLKFSVLTHRTRVTE